MNRQRTISSAVVLVMAMAVMGLAACASGGGGGGGGIPDGDPLPEGKSFSGLWHSDQFQHMYLHQEGDRVHGVYGYGGGGTIEGEVDGNVLLFSWEEPGDQAQAEQGMEGKGFLQFRTDGPDPALVGEWGYNQDRRGAGPWEADFIRDLEADDPQTIEEYNEVH